MRIALINIPLRKPGSKTEWITVPPEGYGGIQWNVATLTDGLLSLGHHVTIFGAPSSKSWHCNQVISDLGDLADIASFLKYADFDVVHDFSNGLTQSDVQLQRSRYIQSHCFTGHPCNPSNVVYLSFAQRAALGDSTSPVVRIPVNPAYYDYSDKKENYFLYLGRVSRWKGVKEAGTIASLANTRLVVAGPAWEQDYFEELRHEFGSTIDFVGPVYGKARSQLIAKAKAVCVMSQSVAGPWGHLWCEPGATVVSEAAVSGTAVISTDNGCLAEIVPMVGIALPVASPLIKARVFQILADLPNSKRTRETAIREWGYVKIAQQYLDLYTQIEPGYYQWTINK